MSTDHVEVMRLLDYARGRLGRRSAHSVREHCMGCEDCGDQLAAALLLRESTAGAEAARPAAASRRYPAAAAAAAAVLLAGAAFWSQDGLVRRAGSIVDAPRGDAIAPGAEGPRLPASVEPVLTPMIWGLELHVGDVRTVSAGSRSLDLRDALVALRAGDAALVTERLAAYELGADPAVDIVVGTAQLLRGNASAAAERLSNALVGVRLTDPNTRAEFRGAAVFLAEAFAQQGDIAAALATLERVVAGNALGEGPDRATTAARARIEELGLLTER
jgi:hypothetical protein